MKTRKKQRPPEAATKSPEGHSVQNETPKKGEAIMLLGEGMPIAKVCETIGVGRMTLWRWRQEPDFQRELANLRDANLADAIEQIGSLTSRAVGVLEVALGEQTPIALRIRAACAILDRQLGRPGAGADIAGNTPLAGPDNEARERVIAEALQKFPEAGYAVAQALDEAEQKDRAFETEQATRRARQVRRGSEFRN